MPYVPVPTYLMIVAVAAALALLATALPACLAHGPASGRGH
ncbi:hypothetical protein [Nonomuraea sp. NPDC049129]